MMLKNEKHLDAKTKKEEQNDMNQNAANQNMVSQNIGSQNNVKQNNVKKKKHHWGIFVASGLAALFVLGYLSAAMYFQTHFLPNTTVNGQNCSYQVKEYLTGALEEIELKYRLDVEEKEGLLIGSIGADDIQMSIDIQENVTKILDGQNIYLWPISFFSKNVHEMEYTVEFSEEKARELVKGFEALDNKGRIAPENAYISDYSSQLKGYEIIPETMGTQMDMNKVEDAVLKAIRESQSKVNLEEYDSYSKAEVTAQDEKLKAKAEKLNKMTGTRITYDWNGSEVILDGDTIHEWIIEDGQKLVLDEEAVSDFVASNAKANDTYGKKRKFSTALGQELMLPSGGFGWRTNRGQEAKELIALIEQGSVTDREPVYSSRGANKGSNDIGDSFVEIDLSNQHLYLYHQGNLVLESDFVSGKMSQSGSVTPPGVFGLTYKTTNAVLRGEDYETPVNYWMPFNGNIGMHDATWRKSFGGDIFLTSGSHGCINLPLAKAKEIYAYISTGYPVICYYY